MTNKIFIILTVSFLMSCSLSMKKWYPEIDRKQVQERDMRGGRSQRGARGIQDNLVSNRKPSNANFHIRSGMRVLSTANTNDLSPRVERHYGKSQKRNRINDLYDNGNEGSLWFGVGQGNYFFSRNNIKKNGDIVIIDVGDKLKKDIMFELSRRFPSMINRRKKIGDKNKNKNLKKSDDKDRKGVKNRISGVVIEEINQGHLIVRGRKDVFHKKRKRLVEVQALISRRDIGDFDTIHSDKILESKVLVLR